MADDERWDMDEDAFLAEWEAVDRQALALLESLLHDELRTSVPEADVERAAEQVRAGVKAGRAPYDYFVNGLDWATPPTYVADELLVDAVAATISPPYDPGTEPDQQAAVESLTHADWLAIVVGLVRAGAGTTFGADEVAAAINALDEIEAEEPAEGEEFRLPVEVLRPLWQATGVLDADDRLTAVGQWVLPQALSLVWTHPEHDVQAGPQLDEEQAAQTMALVAERPRTLPELVEALAADGIETDQDQVDRSLVWRKEMYFFDDEVYAHLPTLAEGVVLTHRLTARERELGMLGTGLDLELFGLLALDGHPFAGGGELESVHRYVDTVLPDDALGGIRGPQGWLEEYGAGDLLGLRYDGRSISLERVVLGEPSGLDTIADVARLVAQRDAEVGDPSMPGAPSYDVVLEARRHHPDLFREALPPLSELLADVAGIEVEYASIGLPGTDWQHAPAWVTSDERAGCDTWRAALREHRLRGNVPSPEAAVALARSLGGRLTAVAALDLTLEPSRVCVAEAMADVVEGSQAAVPLYLRGRAAEARGDGGAWRALLEEAVAADPTMSDPTAELADLRALAGDAKEAHRLYGLAGFETSAYELRDLRTFLEPAAGEVGRNHPCPCGSGKKYKVCHGRDARHPLPDRAVWLWQKAGLFAGRQLNEGELRRWAMLLAGSGRQHQVDAMSDSQVTTCFTLFDGGVLQRLLDLHGDLLPDDERALLESWVAVPARLLEVTDVNAAKRVVARDLVSDEEVVFRNRSGSAVAAGDVLLSRLLEDGSGQPALLHAPVPVAAPVRDGVALAVQDGSLGREIAVLLSGSSAAAELSG